MAQRCSPIGLKLAIFGSLAGRPKRAFGLVCNGHYPIRCERGYPDTVFLDDVPLKPVDALSKVVPGTFYFDYAADKVYIADNPTGHKVEAGKLDYAFRGNEYAGNVPNVTTKNLTIEKYDSPVQQGAIQAGPGWTVQDNEVRLNYGFGITARTDCKIVGNFVHDNGQGGINATGNNILNPPRTGNNILVEGNEVARNGFWSGIDMGDDGGGMKFGNTDGLIVRSNYSHDNKGTGMWTDWEHPHGL